MLLEYLTERPPSEEEPEGHSVYVEDAPVLAWDKTEVECTGGQVSAALLRLLQYLCDRLHYDVHEFLGTSTESVYSGFVARLNATLLPNEEGADDDILTLEFSGSVPGITPHATRVMFGAPSAFQGGYEPYVLEVLEPEDPESLVRQVRINQRLGMGPLGSSSTEFASPLASCPVQLIRYATLPPWQEIVRCEDFEGIPTETVPFSYCYTFGPCLRQLWCSLPFREEQAMVGFPTFNLERIGTPSLWFLAGVGYPLVTPAGYHTAAIIPDGGWYGAKNAFRDSADDHGVGHFPIAVDGWTNQKDPITNTNTLGDVPEDSRDPGAEKRYHFPRTGYMLQMDTGASSGRGYHQWSHVIKQAPAPAVKVMRVAGVHAGTRADFVYFETAETFLGDEYEARIEVHRLAQAEKTELTRGSGMVHSIDRDGDIVKITLENTTRQIVLGVVSNADVIGSWKAGGSLTMAAPPDHMRPQCFYDTKLVGDGNGVSGPGDALGFANLPGMRFVIDRVLPHSGDEAAAWDETGEYPTTEEAFSVFDELAPDGDYLSYGRKRDVIWVYDECGAIDSEVVGETVTLYWSSGVFLPNPDYALQWFDGSGWAEVAGAVFEHGRGYVWIPEVPAGALRMRIVQ